MSNRFQRWYSRFSKWLAVSDRNPPAGGATRTRQRRTPPSLEQLESRLAPAIYVVTGLADGTGSVRPTGTSGIFIATTLRAAISAVDTSTTGANNVIDLDVAGTYKITLAGTPGESDNAAGEFAIIPTGTNGSSLTIQNTSGGVVVVDGNHLNRVFDINPGNTTTTPKFSVTMSSFSIADGLASPGDGPAGTGGGIRDQNNVSLTLNNMTIADNTATADGGGVSMENVVSTPWTLTVNNSTVIDNHAGDAGGGLETDGSGKVFVNGSTIRDNTSVNQGAGIWLDAILASNGTVGSATVTAGGTGYTAPTVTINDPTGTGATGFATVANGSIISVTITNPGTGYTAPTITITDPTGAGAAATANLNDLQSANLTVTDSLITNNKALSATTGVGGGIGNAGNGAVTILNSTISSNTAGGVGGGFSDQNNLGTLAVVNSWFLNNEAAGNGGAIQEGGPDTSITYTQIQGNSTGGVGGGIFASGLTLYLHSSTIAKNVAASNGGGIEVATTGTGLNASAIIDSTITGNLALNAAGASGGGIDAEETGDLVLLNDTINTNFATNGGGLFWPGANGTLAVENSIIAANTIASGGSGPDVSNAAGTIQDNGGNLIGVSGAGSGNTGFSAATTQTGTVASPLNPLLGPLAFNGGPVVGSPGSTTPLLTEALLLGSPAFRKGILSQAPPTDERGLPSLVDNAINVGAVSNIPTVAPPHSIAVAPSYPLVFSLMFNGAPTTVYNVNTTADVLVAPAGQLSLRQAINMINSTTNGNNAFINLRVAGTYAITLVGTPGETDNQAGEFAIIPNGTNGTSLSIQNISGAPVTISANYLNRVFDINPNNTTTSPKYSVTFTGFTIANGEATPDDGPQGTGGGIRDQGNVSLTLNNITLSNNLATADGGGVSMENVVSTPWALTLNNCVVTGNHAGDAGGGVETDGSGKLVVTGSTISDNTSANQGAGIWLDAIGTASAKLTVTRTLVSGNASLSAGGTDGGIGNAGNGAVSIMQSTILSNFAAATGGGVGDDNNLGTLALMNSVVANNTAVGNGGGLNEGGPTVSVTNSQIAGNATGGAGGGLNADGGASLYNILNATFNGNVSATSGAALELANSNSGSTFNITNATIANNVADNNATGFGGGIDAEEAGGTVTLLYDTINGNFASGDGTNSGSGVYWVGNGTFNVQNTIVAANLIGLNAGSTANSVGPDAFDLMLGTNNFTDNGGNLIGVGGAGSGNNFPGTGTTQAGTVAAPLNPLLAPLGYYLGPIIGAPSAAIGLQTEPPVAGSPALGKGIPITPPTTDERGYPRLYFGKTNVGAVEAQLTFAPPFVPGGLGVFGL